MSMTSEITGSRRVKVWQADAEWPDDTFVVPAEDYDIVTTDRDIKTANLQLLVENVLSAELLQLSTGRDISPDEQREEDRKLAALVDLARSLKQ